MRDFTSYTIPLINKFQYYEVKIGESEKPASCRYVAQARGVVGLTPGNCWLFCFPAGTKD